MPYIVHKRMPYIVHKRMPYIVHKRMPYIVHKRMPYIVHKRMPYIVHKRMMGQMSDEEMNRLLGELGPYPARTLRVSQTNKQTNVILPIIVLFIR